MLLETEAIVLKTVDYKESSRIVRLFTQKKGKLSIVAKGARKLKSRYAGFFETGQHLMLSLYYKEGRGLQNIKEVDFETRTFSIRNNLLKQIQLYRILELSDQLLVEGEVNLEKWSFLVELIKWIEQQETIPPNLFSYCQLRIAQIQGLGISIPQSIDTVNKYGLSLESGSITNDTVEGRFYPLSPASLSYLMDVLYRRSLSALSIPLKKDERQHLEHTLDHYLQYHIDGLRPRKTDKIYKEFL